MEKENRFVLTGAQIKESAESYIPIEEKLRFVNESATGCFDKMEISTEDGDLVPPLYKENSERKARYLMTALVTLYLHIPCETEDGNPNLMTREEYDLAAAAFPLNKMEYIKRTTGDIELREKLYDIIVDYKQMERMLNAECYGLMNAMNDPVARFQSMMSATATPEAMKALSEASEKAINEMNEYLNTRKAGA